MNDQPRATRRVIALVVMLIVLLIIAAGVWIAVQGLGGGLAQTNPTPTSLPSPTNEGGAQQTTAPGEATQADQTQASQPGGQDATPAPGEPTLSGSTPDTAQPASTDSTGATEPSTESAVSSSATPTQGSGGGNSGGGTSPTKTPSGSQTATTQPPPTATLAPTVVPPIAVGAVGIGVGSNIGSGTARLVSATRPGTSRITSLGGSVPTPPSGSSWVLVELLDICSGTTNCSPGLSAMKVVGTSGTLYSTGTGFTMDPIFGPSAYVNGQVWGYMGFIVPDSEAQLWLIITVGAKTYPFAMQ